MTQMTTDDGKVVAMLHGTSVCKVDGLTEGAFVAQGIAQGAFDAQGIAQGLDMSHMAQ